MHGVMGLCCGWFVRCWHTASGYDATFDLFLFHLGCPFVLRMSVQTLERERERERKRGERERERERERDRDR